MVVYMATLIFSSIGGFVAGDIGGFFGAAAGYFFDQKIFTSDGLTQKNDIERLVSQNKAYGASIPIVFGTVCLAGNIIWALPIKETAFVDDNNNSTRGKSSSKSFNIQYNYYATLALGLCEGEIDEITRIWANEQELDINRINISIYKGSEEQLPDATMSIFDKATPAYRGLCYVVIEDFPLGEYGNRIPSFLFEVNCNKKYISQNSFLNKINSINLTPGFGEFSYDTTIQSKIATYAYTNMVYEKGSMQYLNNNSNSNFADIIVSLNLLKETFSNLEWISVIVNWFVDTTDCGSCKVYPAVEYKDGFITIPNNWSVANTSLGNAQLIVRDESDKPIYGGTPSDSAIINLFSELKKRRYKILLYPMLLVNNNNGLSRSDITGNATSVERFFTNSGYIDFINHYVSLGNGFADCIVIGSALKGLTSISATDGSYPAIKFLKQLADSVKRTTNNKMLVTYSADWTEYHAADLDYNMDDLWSSDNIDFVGIEAFFPLGEDGGRIDYNPADISKYWSSGEGYDYYYSDPINRTGKTNYVNRGSAWKDIGYWQANSHIKNNGTTTAWRPNMKKIWFIAYGFGSIDNCAAQPSVFYYKYNDSNFPRGSWGNADFRAQYVAIKGTVERWSNSNYVERMFLWYWDARPYPYFPSLSNIWPDTDKWKLDHSVQGKIGTLNLSDILRYVFSKNNVSVVADKLNQYVDGFIISNKDLIDVVKDLSTCYFFDTIQDSDIFIATPRFNNSYISIPDYDLLQQENKSTIIISRSGDNSLPKEIILRYFGKIYNIGIFAASARIPEYKNYNNKISSYTTSLVFNDDYAHFVAESLLHNIWLERDLYKIQLPLKYYFLKPSDIIEINFNNVTRRLRIINTKYGNFIKVTAVEHFANSLHDGYTKISYQNNINIGMQKNRDLIFNVFDLPNKDGIHGILIAVCPRTKDWSGAAAYLLNGDRYELLTVVNSIATMGLVVGKLNVADFFGVIDNINAIMVTIYHGSLSSVTMDELLSGMNTALIGNEIIQFLNAVLITENTYLIFGLLRGRYGTENYIDKHNDNEFFLLLDQKTIFVPLENSQIGAELKIAVLPIDSMTGRSVDVSALYNAKNTLTIQYKARALIPYSVVYIEGTRNQNDDSIKISWCRRCRINGELRDFVDIPLDEDYERYEIDIISSGDIVRTLYVNNQSSLVYLHDDQIVDFNHLPESIELVIYQISSIIGRGSESRMILHFN